MKERPILFSTPMVRAILEGRKTMTRRVVMVNQGRRKRMPCEPYHDDIDGVLWAEDGDGDWLKHEELYPCPYGQPGDRLWVRETWNIADPEGKDALPEDVYGPLAPYAGCEAARRINWRAIYRASSPEQHPVYGKAVWRPSIHMPRWASRITLEITGVRVERLRDITEADAKAEGVELARMLNDKEIYEDYLSGGYAHSARDSFRTLWDSINGKRPGCSWNDNPWVWVVEFKRLPEISR